MLRAVSRTRSWTKQFTWLYIGKHRHTSMCSTTP